MGCGKGEAITQGDLVAVSVENVGRWLLKTGDFLLEKLHTILKRRHVTAEELATGFRAAPVLRAPWLTPGPDTMIGYPHPGPGPSAEPPPHLP